MYFACSYENPRNVSTLRYACTDVLEQKQKLSNINIKVFIGRGKKETYLLTP
jgi:hypothetical protein